MPFLNKTALRGLALAAIAFVAAPYSAFAGGHSAPGGAGGGSGFYASGFLGGSFASDADFEGVIGGSPQSVEAQYDTGLAVGIAVGKQWGVIGALRPRTEIELSYRENDIDELFFSGNGPAAEINVAGDSSSTTLFANALVDIPLQGAPVTPYIGAGIGIAFTQQDFVYGPGVHVGDSDDVFAAQLIAGASYDLSDRIALTLDGRYQRAFGVTSRRVAPTGAVTGVIEDDLDSFTVALGMRVKF